MTLFAALSAGAKTYLLCNLSIFLFSAFTERLLCNLSIFLFSAFTERKKGRKYQNYVKTPKIPKLRQNMHRCDNINLHLNRPPMHSVQLYCLWAVFFDESRNDVPNVLGSIAFLDFTDAGCKMHRLVSMGR